MKSRATHQVFLLDLQLTGMFAAVQDGKILDNGLYVRQRFGRWRRTLIHPRLIRVR